MSRLGQVIALRPSQVAQAQDLIDEDDAAVTRIHVPPPEAASPELASSELASSELASSELASLGAGASDGGAVTVVTELPEHGAELAGVPTQITASPFEATVARAVTPPTPAARWMPAPEPVPPPTRREPLRSVPPPGAPGAVGRVLPAPRIERPSDDDEDALVTLPTVGGPSMPRSYPPVAISALAEAPRWDAPSPAQADTAPHAHAHAMDAAPPPASGVVALVAQPDAPSAPHPTQHAAPYPAQHVSPYPTTHLAQHVAPHATPHPAPHIAQPEVPGAPRVAQGAPIHGPTVAVPAVQLPAPTLGERIRALVERARGAARARDASAPLSSDARQRIGLAAFAVFALGALYWSLQPEPELEPEQAPVAIATVEPTAALPTALPIAPPTPVPPVPPTLPTLPTPQPTAPLATPESAQPTAVMPPVTETRTAAASAPDTTTTAAPEGDLAVQEAARLLSSGREREAAAAYAVLARTRPERRDLAIVAAVLARRVAQRTEAP